ncbi:MAG TPA: AtpZ/AtpI family protein [Chitinophagaceae bacterium]|nr:AtpZ/AtpI family protein [Chitinophagaceae bacterium]
MKRKRPSSSNSNRDLLRYAGLGTQMLVSMGIAVFIGLKTDKWLHTLPLFSCVLPLLVLVAIFYKLMRQTGRKNKM